MTMPEVRPIDANALLELYTPTDDFVDIHAYKVPVPAVVQNILDQPTLDYAPVRHGHWIHCAGKSNLWYCSECGGKILYNPTRRTYNIKKLPVDEMNRFCRSCGAKMDGGNDK